MMRLLVLIICLAFASMVSSQTNIIPRPVSMQPGKGSFVITKSTSLVVKDAGDMSSAEFLNSYLKRFYGFQLPVSKSDIKNAVTLTTRKFITAPDKDAYSLIADPDGITIEGDTYTGTFYGMQTLIQLFPVPGPADQKLNIPGVTITDYPGFSYRGLHLDVSRHFFPVDFIKKYIDYIALHKMNYFHWHLTDDQGWRIEIKKYQKLTETGAWRNGTIIGRYPGTGNDKTKHGGFYTQEQVKEIVKYAAERYITVVPEIEMPGHGSAAIAAYPELSCFPGEPTFDYFPKNCEWYGDKTGKQVQQTWGVFDDVFCAGKENTFKFLEDVLNEIIPLFPGKYVHVGGDECPKANWKRCASCQQRMKDNHLEDEHELQSYFINRMEKYLNNKGKVLIGWDEILEGGLAPNAIVMSWRGESGGIEAAKQKHQVIMTPGNPVYFDHTQSENEDSVTIGGFNPIEKVYAYEPVPAALNEEEGKYVMGAQANLWTEYMKNPRKVEYMLFPRLAALSEVLWSPKEKKSWDDFENRLKVQFKRYYLWKANYSQAFFELKTSVIPAPDNKAVSWKLESKIDNVEIMYTTDKSTQQMSYTAPVSINKSMSLTANIYSGKNKLNTVSQAFHFNKATGKKITLANEASKAYPGDGAFTLVNGVQNTKGRGRSKEFLGFNGGDCEAVIDLGKDEKFSFVTVHAFRQEGAWIYQPSSVEVLLSADGENFSSIGITDDFKETKNGNGIMQVELITIDPVRFVKVIIRNRGVIQEGKPGAGNNAWLFVDEIEIN